MDNEYELIEKINLLVKRWWVMVICMVLAGASVYAYTIRFISPTYVSKGMLYVNNSNSEIDEILKNTNNANRNLNDIVASQRLATTYIEILKSDSFMLQVSEAAGIDMSPSRLRSMVSVQAKNETEILEVTVTDISPQDAAVILQAVLEKAKEEIVRIIRGGSVEIIDNASIPKAPSGPDTLKNTFIGLVIGIVIGVIIILVTDIIDNRVKNKEQLTYKYDYPVLGLIPSFHRNKDLNYGSPPDVIGEEFYV